jgi:hypothetical protein
VCVCVCVCVFLNYPLFAVCVQAYLAHARTHAHPRVTAHAHVFFFVFLTVAGGQERDLIHEKKSVYKERQEQEKSETREQLFIRIKEERPDEQFV